MSKKNITIDKIVTSDWKSETDIDQNLLGHPGYSWPENIQAIVWLSASQDITTDKLQVNSNFD